jgi:hypothetical protein
MTAQAISATVEKVMRENSELRAENGRQAATIAALRGVGKVRIETPHTGRDDKALFRDWMESQPTDVLKPEPLRLEVGKTYVRRDGGLDRVVANEDAHQTIEFRFIADSFNTYREDGRFCGTAGHPADLVALAPTIDPASPHP